MLVTPHADPRKFMQSVKGYMAREEPKILDRAGEPFWQSESYDHWVRSDEEFQKIKRYIEENSVTAGLVMSAEDFRGSSAFERG
jgi:hypothetical protein